MTSDTYDNMTDSMKEIKNKCSEATYYFIRGHIADLERSIDNLTIKIEQIEEANYSYYKRNPRYHLEDA
jgi:hypothetical protein